MEAHIVYRRVWRALARARQNHALRACADYDTLQIHAASRLTDVREWY